MGLIWEYFTFAGKSTDDFNVRISGSGTFDAPARDVSKVSVPGRNGDLTFDNGRFENIEISYPAFITEDFDANFSAFKAFLGAQRGYKRLADSYHPDYFRMAMYKDALKPQMAPRNGSGSFEVKFDCKPQRYLKSGEKTKEISSFPAILKNPTQYASVPLIRLYGSGTLTIGDISIVLSTSSSYVDIDCELEEALVAAENLNITTTGGKFPKLNPGNNTINWTGSKIEITPRYFTI